MTNQLYLRFYTIFVKWRSFATPEIELLLSINLLLCMSSLVLAVVQIMWEKPKECYTLYERYVEPTQSYQNSIVKNHPDQCAEVQYLLNITSLGATLFSNDNSISNDKWQWILDCWKLAIVIIQLFVFSCLDILADFDKVSFH